LRFDHFLSKVLFCKCKCHGLFYITVRFVYPSCCTSSLAVNPGFSLSSKPSIMI
jgi:hypothetical protein